MRLVSILLSAVAVGACASSGTPSDGDGPSRRVPVTVHMGQAGTFEIEIVRDDHVSTASLDLPVRALWSELLDVYTTDLGISASEITLLDPSTHRVGVSELRISRLAGERLSRFLDCGHRLGTSKADQGQVQITLNTQLEAQGAATLVRTRFQATAKDVGSSTAAVWCSSNGLLERLLMESLHQRAVASAQGG